MKRVKTNAEVAMDKLEIENISLYEQLKKESVDGTITECRQLLLDIMNRMETLRRTIDRPFISRKKLMGMYSKEIASRPKGYSKLGRRIQRKKDLEKRKEQRRYMKRMIRKRAEEAAREAARELMEKIEKGVDSAKNVEEKSA